ncbi:unnamed protein product [Fusarium graminearum]|nr:unnamed protein product [Fusarium graminearum]
MTNSPSSTRSKCSHAVPFTTPPFIQNSSYLGRVEPVEQYHNKEHQEGIENVEIDFMLEQETAVTLNVLNRSEKRSHHDEQATDVKNHHVLLPWKSASRPTSWVLEDGSMEGDGDNDKDSKENELDE